MVEAHDVALEILTPRCSPYNGLYAYLSRGRSGPTNMPDNLEYEGQGGKETPILQQVRLDRRRVCARPDARLELVSPLVVGQKLVPRTPASPP